MNALEGGKGSRFERRLEKRKKKTKGKSLKKNLRTENLQKKIGKNKGENHRCTKQKKKMITGYQKAPRGGSKRQILNLTKKKKSKISKTRS